MTEIDWKTQMNSVLIDNYIGKDVHGVIGGDENDLYNAMIEFAKLACEEQKKICAENATVELNADSDGCLGFYDEGKSLIYADLDQYSDFGIFPQKSSILNSPTVKFE